MVSWFRSFHLRWSKFAREFDADAVEIARGSQVTFGLIDPKDPTFEFDLDQWFTTFKTRSEAGVFFVATKPQFEGGPGEILAFHHWLVMDGNTTPDMIGIESFEATVTFRGVKSVELFGKLIAHRGAKKAGASDFFVPSLDGLIEGLHPLKGKFVPGAKDACLAIQALESKINGVLVPVPLAQLLLGDEVDLEDSDDEESTETFNLKDPMHLLKRLVKVMKHKKEKEGNWYKRWKSIAEEIVTLLWATANGFAVGVDVLPAKNNRQSLAHQVNCAQELLDSDKELYGNDSEEDESKQRDGDSVKDSRGARGRRSVGPVLGLELLTRGSPRSRGTASPSARKERGGVSFESPQATQGDSQGETKDPEQVDEIEGGPGEPGTGTGPGKPTGAPEWAGNIAGQFMAGFLATTKALTVAGESLGELAKASKKSLDEKEEMKLATFKWIKSGEFLLKVLSTEDGWNTEGVPQLTKFAQAIIKMKLFAATQHIRAQAQEEEWPGGLLKSGVSEFLKRGFVAEDIQVGPSGFSVLFFHPSSFTETDGDEFGVQQLRESFGDGKLPEEMMKAFSKLNIYIPKNTYEAAEQVETAIRFLKCLCGENTIAIGGYTVGHQHLTRSRRLFEAKDKLFLLNYMYMLDRVFQSFCSELKKYIDEEDPVQVAKATGAQRWMEKLVDTPVQNWKVTGTIPTYSSPSAWDERKLGEGVVDLSGGKGRSIGGGGGAASPPLKRKKVEKGQGDEKELPWHRALDSNEYVKDWFLPSNSKFFQYFNPDRAENFVGLPMVAHHRTGRKAYICVRYIVGNGPGCNRGINCARSHIRMKDLSQEEKDIITAHFKDVYEGKKKSS